MKNNIIKDLYETAKENKVFSTISIVLLPIFFVWGCGYIWTYFKIKATSWIGLLTILTVTWILAWLIGGLWTLWDKR